MKTCNCKNNLIKCNHEYFIFFLPWILYNCSCLVTAQDPSDQFYFGPVVLRHKNQENILISR